MQKNNYAANKSYVKKISDSLANIIFPHICLVCKKRLLDKKQVICASCEKKFAVKRLSAPENFKKFHLDSSNSVFIYQEPVSSLICLFKYKAKLSLGNFFGQKMVEYIKNFPLLNNIDIIVPIPLHQKRLREREFNQAEILAGIISREYNFKLESKAIVRIHMKNVQSSLKKDKRFENIKGAFKIKQDIFRNKNILLVDDVFTTGATLSEAALTLKEAGASQVRAFTLARTINENIA
ncbi:MAG: ComF family protein [Candidatus Omnitrophota bacterium]